MSRLAGFFKDSDTTLGVFYPNHYLVAVFRTLERAEHVVGKLLPAGFVQDDVIAVSGKDVLDFTSEEMGLGNVLMQALSRFFATEQVYTDHDLEHARHGAGFLAVHCPSAKLKEEAWRIIDPEGPLDARYYAGSGVEHLAGDLHTD